MKVQLIRSATVIIEFAHSRFLVDPWLQPKGTFPPLPYGIQERQPLCDLPLPLEQILDVDAVIVTHLHYDHFCQDAAKHIPKDMTIFCQDEIDADELRKYGFTNIKIITFDIPSTFNDVTIHKVNCDHGAKEIYLPPTRKDAFGFILTSPKEEKKVYLAGDTIYCQYVKDAINTFKPEVIIVNGCEATHPEFGPLIIGIDGIRDIHKDAPDATIVVVHMETVTHYKYTRADIRKFIDDEHLEKSVLLPNDGEILSF
ncbi:hypothetical protein TRFO_01332 [Tritrichomonas foetus]|uniref:Metallo-beta-lactamase domain-containing protein n=1 Tax=Tritrichomonas foetus TaxID=1144522 RepID=A0A1J4K897_9EUKA|nr:hypothetical protein TRFO_01332 [Tritrichomonas foetus]|eukprot:OHT07194.1 hypothetical protein TRFO_01332 [Tritrichomonas foetus]